MTNTDAIRRFLEDINSLEPLRVWAERLNIFDILGISRTEIRHSNMLAWLMDPNGNHGLGDEVLRGILELISPSAQLQDLHTFIIRREWNCIDLMAVSDAEQYVLCIENKIDTGEHDDQLARYRDLVEGTFQDYTKAYIYLTPAGRESSDPDNWRAMGYGDILRIIEKAMQGKQLKPEADLIIRNYVDTIRRDVIKDENIRKTCEEIFRKHQLALEKIWDNTLQDEEKALCEKALQQYRSALNLIRKNLPPKGTDRIADIIHLWAKERTEEGKIEADLNNTSDKTTRFKTRRMSEILPDVPGRKSAWKTENFYFYEIRNVIQLSHEHEIYFQLSIGSADLPDDMRITCDRINDIFPANHKKEDWSYRIPYTTKHIILSEDTDEEKIINLLDGYLEDVNGFEEELAEKMGVN